jgi:predicted permease
MSAPRVLLSRIAALFRKRSGEREFDEEVRAHLDLLEQEHRGHGLSAAEARSAALRDFGGVGQIKETWREQRGWPFLDSLAQDLRFAVRMMRRTPDFSAVVIAVLAIGIGANSAMFTLVDAMLFRPLQGSAGDLLGLYSHDPTRPDSYRSFSYQAFREIQDRGDLFEGVMAHVPGLVGLPSGDVTRRAFIELVSSNFFSTIGVPLAAGRTFTLEEERPGADLPVAVVGYRRWKEADLDPAFVGSTLRVNSRDFTIVGVAPEGFTGTTALMAPELWLPLGMYDSIVSGMFRGDAGGLAERSSHSLILAGRLARGLGRAEVDARLLALSRQLEAADPVENRDQRLTVSPLSRVGISTSPTDDTGPFIVGALLMPMSGAVLLIACLNIANMFLARGTARKKEIAIRLALGGGRRRIVRQLLTEGLALSLVAACGGLLVGYWTTRLLTASFTSVMPMLIAIELDPSPGANVLAATTAFAVISTLVFGLAPALRVSKRDVVADLKDAGGDTRAPGRRFGMRSWLVISQIAVSLMLMTAGGLFARGAMRASLADPGFRYDGMLLLGVDPSLAGYDEARGRESLRALLDRLRGTPGVAAVGMASQVPFGDFYEGRPVERPGVPASPDGARSAAFTIIGSDYFTALGLPILRGRDFTRAEETSASAPRVAIIDEPLARLLFPEADPLGESIRLAPRGDGGERAEAETEPMQIVGVVPGLRDKLFDRSPTAHIYVPGGPSYRPGMTLHIRIDRSGPGVEASMLAAIRREVQSGGGGIPVVDLLTMRGFHDRSVVLWSIRAAGVLLTCFGGIALLLASVGVYGVKSYLVSQRTREIGIRMALGATKRDVLLLVLRQGAVLTTVGLSIGLPLAVLLGQVLGSMLFDVSPLDPLVFTLAPGALALAATLASYVPALRAARIAPLDALRTE